MMSVMAEIAKAMAEQKRENREMRDVNAHLAVQEKLSQATELEKKAEDMWDSALTKAVVGFVVGGISMAATGYSLSKTFGALKEAKTIENTTSEVFKDTMKAQTGFESAKEATEGLKNAAVADKNLNSVADLTQEDLLEIQNKVNEATKAATEAANNAVDKTAESVYKSIDGYNKIESLGNSVNQTGNSIGNLVAGRFEHNAAMRDAEIKKSEAREQEYQAFTDNLRQLMDSNKELVDSANRAMQTISDGRVQTMNKVLG